MIIDAIPLNALGKVDRKQLLRVSVELLGGRLGRLNRIASPTDRGFRGCRRVDPFPGRLNQTLPVKKLFEKLRTNFARSAMDQSRWWVRSREQGWVNSRERQEIWRSCQQSALPAARLRASVPHEGRLLLTTDDRGLRWDSDEADGTSS